MGKRKRQQQEFLLVAAAELAPQGGRLFYPRGNKLRDRGRFDDYVESSCQTRNDA